RRSGSWILPREHGVEVLVTAAAEVHDEELGVGHREGVCDRVRGLERGEDAFGAGEGAEGGGGFGVGDGDIAGATGLFEEGVLGADAGIVETGGGAGGFVGLTVW